MNKMISYLFWVLIPFLFFASLLPHTGHDPGFYFPIKDEFIRYEPLIIWFFNATYFFIIGFVLKK